MKNFIYWFFPLLLWHGDYLQSEKNKQNSTFTWEKKSHQAQSITPFAKDQAEKSGSTKGRHTLHLVKFNRKSPKVVAHP